MIKVRELNILNNFSTSYLLIKFSIDSTDENIDDYRFDILKSKTVSEDFSVIAYDVKNFQKYDHEVNLLKQTNQFLYKIRVTNLITGQVEESEAAKIQFREPDSTALSIMHQYNIYLKNIIKNPPIHIFQKKRFGQKCNCWDDIRKQRKREFCMECYNTGFIGGYYSGIKTEMSYLSTDSSLQQLISQSDIGEQASPIQIWIKNLPLVQPGDIIVDNLNRRYEVINWQPTVKNGYILRQILNLSKLPAADIAYKIPIIGDEDYV